MYHQLEKTESGYKCMACDFESEDQSRLSYKECFGVPEYPWFDKMPDNLKTKTMLKALRMKPGKVVRGFIYWQRARTTYYLYDIAEATPMKPLSEKQKE